MKRFILVLFILTVGIAIGRWSSAITTTAKAQERSSGQTTQGISLGESAGRFQAVYFEVDADHALVDSQTGRVWHFVRSDPKEPYVLQEVRRVDLDQQTNTKSK